MSNLEDGNLYYIGGTYERPYINRVVLIEVDEENEYEVTRYDAVMEVISDYEKGKIPVLQGRTFDDICRFIGERASDKFGIRVSIGEYTSDNRKKFSKLRKTGNNRVRSEIAESLRQSIEERIERGAASGRVGEDTEGNLMFSERTESESESTLAKHVAYRQMQNDALGNEIETLRNLVRLQGKAKICTIKNSKNLVNQVSIALIDDICSTI